MSATNTALIAVDVQRDFIDGSLGGEGRDKVIEPLKKLAHEADFVVFTRDWHPYNHCSFADEPEFKDGSWPVHCVQHTAGAEIPQELLNAMPIDHCACVDKGMDPDREEYSGFWARNDLGMLLPQILYDLGIKRVVIGGLCTEYCVRATAIDAGRCSWLETHVNVHAIAAVYPHSVMGALHDMGDAGAVIDTELP